MELLARQFDLAAGRQTAATASGDDKRLVTVTTSEPPLGSQAGGRASRPDLPRLVAEARKLAKENKGQVPPGLAAIEPEGRPGGSIRSRGWPACCTALPGAGLFPGARRRSATGRDARSDRAGNAVHAVLAELGARPAGAAIHGLRQCGGTPAGTCRCSTADWTSRSPGSSGCWRRLAGPR